MTEQAILQLLAVVVGGLLATATASQARRSSMGNCCGNDLVTLAC